MMNAQMWDVLLEPTGPVDYRVRFSRGVERVERRVSNELALGRCSRLHALYTFSLRRTVLLGYSRISRQVEYGQKHGHRACWLLRFSKKLYRARAR